MRLHYVSDHRPGIRRERCGRGFRYRAPGGKLVRNRKAIERIRALVIPPAWSDVWICPDERGHLQVTGRDERGRKQHLYHPRWREVRDRTKYDRLVDFAQALPRIRRRVRRSLRGRGLSRERVLATVVRLLDMSLIRVGNDEYARENKSYGLTTMKNRHARIAGARITFRFRGKSGKEHEVEVEDRRVARTVRACQELPGQELFQYLDEERERHDVGSGDVNEYLHEITGEDFTAKDFRTWAGTVEVASALRRVDPPESDADAKRSLVAAIKDTARALGNTPAVCRKSYIHPAVIDAWLDGSLPGRLNSANGTHPPVRGLHADEASVFRFLKRVRRGRGRRRRAAK